MTAQPAPAPLSDEARAALDRLSVVMQDAVARVMEKERLAAQNKTRADATPARSSASAR